MLVAVDSTAPLDLSYGVGDVADALDVIRERIAGARLITPPTIALELAYPSEFTDEDDVRSNAHLPGIVHDRLELLLIAARVSQPIIATPRKIVRKFFR